MTFAFAEARVMTSIVLPWNDIKVYLDTIGPGNDQRRPDRPTVCLFCDAHKIWYNGWRFVYTIVLQDCSVHRFNDGLPLQRVICAACSISWTLRPACLYPHRTFSLDVVEKAAATYLSNPIATYASVAKAVGCSPRSVWRWVGWLPSVATPGALVAKAEQHQCTGQAAALMPRAVPQAHPKAYSPKRAAVLLHALQLLCALTVWARAMVVPSDDPSPLRAYLNEQLLTLAEVYLFMRPRPRQKPSPALPGDRQACSRVQKPP